MKILTSTKCEGCLHVPTDYSSQVEEMSLTAHKINGEYIVKYEFQEGVKGLSWNALDRNGKWK